METKYTDYMAWVKAGEALGLTNHRTAGHNHFEFVDKDGYVLGRWSENHGHQDPDARKRQLELEAAHARTAQQFPTGAGVRTVTSGPDYMPLVEAERRTTVRTEPFEPLPAAALGPGVPVKVAPVPPPHPIAPVASAPVSVKP